MSQFTFVEDAFCVNQLECLNTVSVLLIYYQQPAGEARQACNLKVAELFKLCVCINRIDAYLYAM